MPGALMPATEPRSSTNTSVMTMNSSGMATAVGVGGSGLRAHLTNVPSGDGEGTHHTCPVAPFTDYGTGNVYQVSINSADVTQDAISVTLTGGTSPGTLIIQLVGSSPQTIYQASASSGTASYSFNLSSVAAQEYTGISATWSPEGSPVSSPTYSYHIRFLGNTSLTQYNTPNENQCSGAPQADKVYNNSCAVTNTALI